MSAPQTFDDRDGYIWMNGGLLPWRDAKVHVLTHALHYASSVFEGVRAYGGKIFKLEEHTDRLIESARLLDMKIPFTAQQINELIVSTQKELKGTSIVVTHDIHSALFMADRLALHQDGQIVHVGDPETFMQQQNPIIDFLRDNFKHTQRKA